MTNTEPSTIPSPANLPADLSEQDLQELEDMLHSPEAEELQIANIWDFYDGFLTALVCTRESIALQEWLPVMLDAPEALANIDEGHGLGVIMPFISAEQQQRFVDLCEKRMLHVAATLDLEVESLAEENAFVPAVLDFRGAILALPENEREEGELEGAPSFGQLWALGFMQVVSFWDQHWEAPRDHELKQWLKDALGTVRQLIEPDKAAPVLNFHDENAAPSISQQRLDAYSDAIWAIYDLRQIWQSIGPRVLPAVSHKIGRNDLCWCGSGKKFKKCHGA